MIFFSSFSEGFSTIYHQAQTHLSSPSHDCSTSSSALSVDVGFHGAATSVSIRWNCTHTRLCTFFPLVGIKIMGYLTSCTANIPSWTDFGYICPLSGSLTCHCTFRCLQQGSVLLAPLHLLFTPKLHTLPKIRTQISPKAISSDSSPLHSSTLTSDRRLKAPTSH